MLFNKLLCLTLLSSVLILFGLPSLAQQVQSIYPSKPIRLVVPYPAGGPLDLVARTLAEKLRDSMGQPVLVDNKPGAGGNIGADLIAKAASDGYSLLVGAVATHAINPYLYSKIPYDPNRDFSPIIRLAVVPNVLVMNPNKARELGISDIGTLIQYARKHPAKLNYASGGNGSAGHLAGELCKTSLGISMVHIAYAGAPPAQFGLIAGQTDLMFDNLASAAAQIKAGKLQAFAVTTPKRSNFLPEVPSVAESATLSEFDISTWFGIFGPANLPTAMIEKLHTQIASALQSVELKERLSKMAAEAAPMSPSEFAAFIQSEQSKYRQVIKRSGAKVD